MSNQSINVQNSLGQTLNTIGKSKYEISYDQHVKKFLAHKDLLALILKHSITELAEYSNKEIARFIEGDVKIGDNQVTPNSNERIDGRTQENFEIGAGMVVFDLKFNMILPMDKDGEFREVIINLEAQNKFNPGYDIAKRGVYYCSRLISEQMGAAKKSSEYSKLKKVYSIWLFTKTVNDSEIANSITEFKMGQNSIYGDFKKNVEYDLQSMIFICLGKNSNNKMIKAMEKLLDAKTSKEEKERNLQAVDVPLTEELKEGVISMCNLSQGIREEAIEKGIVQGIEIGEIKGLKKGIKTLLNLKINEETILSSIVKEYGLSEGEAQHYLALVKSELAQDV